ncbi:hypothetical protein BCR44DRAFT_1436326, partial [Catenaria anguillulae PL171]
AVVTIRGDRDPHDSDANVHDMLMRTGHPPRTARHAAQVYQTYQDLRYARLWHSVSVSVSLCFATNTQLYHILAWPLDTPLDFALFDAVMSTASPKLPLVLALCSHDSTVVYYHLHEGVHSEPIPPLVAISVSISRSTSTSS